MTRRGRAIVIIAISIGASACSALLAIDDYRACKGDECDASASTDAASDAADVAVVDALPDALPPKCTQVQPRVFVARGGDNQATYGDFADAGAWSQVTVPSIGQSFQGMTFDGKYLYTASARNGGRVARYDTTAPWQPASWTTIALPTIGIMKGGFSGMVLAGNHLYLVPASDGMTMIGVVVRYDVRCDFSDPAAWEKLDVEAASGMPLRGYCGATTDGRYVYFTPYYTTISGGMPTAPNPKMLRYDTTLPFESWSSWSTFDLASIGGGGTGACGAIFDGQNVYVIPHRGSNALVYDTKLPFGSTGSWKGFDTRQITDAGTPDGFQNGGFDGRYVYYVPYRHGASSVYSSSFARYDTSKNAFTAVSSWESVTIGGFVSQAPTTADGFSAAVYDGRYMYFAPFNDTSAVARYDRTQSFLSSSSWTFFDTNTLPGKPGSFLSMGFDGKFVYLAPWAATSFVRFNDRMPPALPALPEYNGSFY